MTTNYPLMSAKHVLMPGPSSSGLIKGAAAFEETEGLVPGYSASGQDVWLDPSDADGRGAGLILSAVGARCGKAFLATASAWGTVANTVAWKISPQWDPEFTHYLFNREDFWIKGGSAQPYVQVPASLAQKVPKFPLEDQVALRKYLNRETAQIDVLIAKQQQLIETLAERRKAVITRTVTRGLDPTIKFKDSGDGWLGLIPIGWTGHGLRHALTFITSGSRGWAEYYADDGDPFIRIGNLPREGYALEMDDTQYVRIPKYTEGTRAITRDGDLLFSITAYLGSIAVVGPKDANSYISQHVAIVRLRRSIFDPRFVAYFGLSDQGQRQLKDQSYGGTKLQLSLQDLRNWVLPRPPIDEQREISAFLDVETTRLDILKAKAKQVIEVLKERRQALISAAVTGKIDVRGEGL